MTAIDGHEPAELSKLEKGYELLGELSRDEIVTVYVARDRLSGIEVAIKVLRASDARGREALAHYASDARLLTALEHPNIVGMHGVKWLSESVVAVITERVRGPTLRQVLDVAGTLPVARATEVLKGLGRALLWAHSSQIMHRDVRPENVIFEEGTGRVVLTDFGLARRLDAVDSGAVDDPYRAPELADGRYPDRRTDVYSLGIVGWELLTGRRPWPDSLEPPLPGRRAPAPPPLAAVRPGLPPALVSAIEGAVQLERDRRIPDVTAFLDRLTGVTPPPPPQPEDEAAADALAVEPSEWVAPPVPKLPTRPAPASVEAPPSDLAAHGRNVVEADGAPTRRSRPGGDMVSRATGQRDGAATVVPGSPEPVGELDVPVADQASAAHAEHAAAEEPDQHRPVEQAAGPGRPVATPRPTAARTPDREVTPPPEREVRARADDAPPRQAERRPAVPKPTETTAPGSSSSPPPPRSAPQAKRDKPKKSEKPARPAADAGSPDTSRARREIPERQASPRPAEGSAAPRSGAGPADLGAARPRDERDERTLDRKPSAPAGGSGIPGLAAAAAAAAAAAPPTLESAPASREGVAPRAPHAPLAEPPVDRPRADELQPRGRAQAAGDGVTPAPVAEPSRGAGRGDSSKPPSAPEPLAASARPATGDTPTPPRASADAGASSSGSTPAQTDTSGPLRGPVSGPVRGGPVVAPIDGPTVRPERMRGGLGTPRSAWGGQRLEPGHGQQLPPPLDPVFDTPAEFPLPLMPDPRPLPPDVGAGAPPQRRPRLTWRGIGIVAAVVALLGAAVTIATMERAPDTTAGLMEPETPAGYAGDVELTPSRADTTSDAPPAGGAAASAGRGDGAASAGTRPPARGTAGAPAGSSAPPATESGARRTDSAPRALESAPRATAPARRPNAPATRAGAPATSAPEPGRTGATTPTNRGAAARTSTTTRGAPTAATVPSGGGAANAPPARRATPPAVVPARTASERTEGVARCGSSALADQRACLSAHLARSDAGLNQVYADVIAAMRRRANSAPADPDPPEVQRLRAAQRAWLVRRDAECRRRGRGREGPLWATPRAQCLEEFSVNRSRELATTLARLRRD